MWEAGEAGCAPSGRARPANRGTRQTDRKRGGRDASGKGKKDKSLPAEGRARHYQPHERPIL